MKEIKLVSLTILVLSLFACDPESCDDYLIKNTTKENLEIYFFSFEKTQKESFVEINSNSYYNQESNCALGNSWRFEYFMIDSIQIKISDVVVKTYYPDSPGKNIFNTQDQDSWRISESKKYYRKFVFEITEEDLN
ncbi:hypothetical protein ACFOUP_10070 [Belliella kenyensis]|uniref:Lipoprotein n=1 Tax=Belliella kenyensis TaxID=1472724 RepID=A0ABV8EK91_9BACT|nr:hypothetical protein [Belliella kenyensis]MCH7403290.1 hypothetical protein [Belliella kenyensis]MDN3602931.1 hypothetical protein [Belliella kenyensis]